VTAAQVLVHLGVCELVDKSLDIFEIPVTKHFLQLEMTCFDVFLGDTQCRFFNVYRKPCTDSNLSIAAMQQIISCLEQFCQTSHVSLLVI